MNTNESDIKNTTCSCSSCLDKATIDVHLDNQFGSYCEICATHVKHHVATEGGRHDLNNEAPGDWRTSVKEYPCKNGCGTKIRFDKDKVSDRGKHIPLNQDGTPHICSKAPKIPCRFCANEISFERTPNGKWIARNPDGSFHECPSWPDVARAG